jgi:hypothetical protein
MGESFKRDQEQNEQVYTLDRGKSEPVARARAALPDISGNGGPITILRFFIHWVAA